MLRVTHEFRCDGCEAVEVQIFPATAYHSQVLPLPRPELPVGWNHISWDGIFCPKHTIRVMPREEL